MLRSGVPLVGIEPVPRKHLMPSVQAGVALHLGEDRSGGDALRDGVAVNQRALWLGDFDLQGVHQQIVRRRLEALDGAPHRETRGLKNIETVNLVHVGSGNGPRHGALTDALGEDRAPLGRKNFAVAQPANGALRGKDDGAGEYRTK